MSRKDDGPPTRRELADLLRIASRLRPEKLRRLIEAVRAAARPRFDA
jgi:hypothetical protein